MSCLNFTDLVRVNALLISERLADTVRRGDTKCRDVGQRFVHLLYGEYMAKLNIFYESSAKSIVFFWKKAENVLKTQDINSYDKPPPHLSSIFVQKRGWKEGASEQPLPRAAPARLSPPLMEGSEWPCKQILDAGEQILGAGEQGTETEGTEKVKSTFRLKANDR